MKYCEEYAALLDLFVDGELTPEETERVRGHLTDCPGCRAYVNDALAIRAGFPDAEETAVPEGFAEGVMERIRGASPDGEKEEGLKRRSFRRWIGTAAALAACCALVVLVQTGPGGMKDAGLTAVTGGAAPSGYDGGESIAPQAAAADTEDMEENAQPRAETKEAAYDSAAGNAESGQRSMPAAAPPAEAAAEAAALRPDGAAAADMAAAYKEMALCLTAGEAGNLLDGFTPEYEDASERRYTLSMEEYEALLEALGRWEKLPETPEMSFQVVVTGPFK